MVFADALTKAGRLVEMQRMFATRPNRGFRTAEIAERLGIAPRTVRKFITEMSASGRLPVILEKKKWYLTPEARIEIPPVRFALEEAAAIYLAARLLCRHVDEPTTAVRSSVAKLASVVPSDLGGVMKQLSTRFKGKTGEQFVEIFRVIAYGWALRREVDLLYRALNWPEPRRCRLRPYLLEPSVRGFSLYVLGHAEPPGQLRVFKLERMIEATLTNETFKPVNTEELLERVDKSWVVWMTDQESVPVRLHFAPVVARQVCEARWHASQAIEERPDGSVEMRLAVASTIELVPWILGWGEACEVLEPADLRRQVAAEHAAAAKRYEKKA
jgi:predicted DNA-binding transcriptional regulator YafY